MKKGFTLIEIYIYIYIHYIYDRFQDLGCILMPFCDYVGISLTFCRAFVVVHMVDCTVFFDPWVTSWVQDLGHGPPEHAYA